ncbi:hypothetical protein KVMX100_120376 [Klebsiella variicola]|uniref:hypothetical protein n=1 Tax=Klebsiella variicola TaxID=244366 RepID=UPI0007D0C6B2|nr:hypothetical protein [Klebsiella variicola]SBM96477.1 hypothetical protein KVMX100_120376 [Klebsiella variicola]
MTTPYEEYVVTPVNELETKEQRDRRIVHERKVGAVFNHPRFRKRDPEDLLHDPEFNAIMPGD